MNPNMETSLGSAWRTGCSMRRVWVEWLVGVAVVVAALFTVAPGEVFAYTPHDPIVIEGNANFTAQNGVTGGSGTPSEPYIIEGWEISLQNGFNTSTAAISIRNTDAYYVIRGVYVHESGIGVELWNASHGKIVDSVFWNDGYGVLPWFSTDIAIIGNSITTDFPTVVGGGIHPFRSADLRIWQNLLVNNGDGVYVQNSDRVDIASNRIEGESDRSEGVRLWVSTNVTITCNDVVRHSIGIRVFNWNTGIVAHHNNILGSAYAQAQDGEANVWDDGYPSGGNYWSDYAGTDQYSGPNQDQPGSDGIGDAPRLIDADSVDRYPLMNPAVCPVPFTPPVTSLVVGEPKVQLPATYIGPGTPMSLSVIDGDGLGIRATSYRIDGGAWTGYAGPFAIPTEGEHLLEWFSEDNRGTVELTKSETIRVDGTPPTTTSLVGDPQYTEGPTYVTSVTPIQLTATDGGVTPVGVGTMEYRLNGAWQDYAGPFFLSGADGPRSIGYRSTDRLGNEESIRSVTLTLDNTPAETSLILVDETSQMTLTLSPSDAGAGIRFTEYRLDDGPWQEYADPIVLTAGEHTVWYRSTDHVNNAEAERFLRVTIDSGPAPPAPAPVAPAVAIGVPAVALGVLGAAWAVHRRRQTPDKAATLPPGGNT